ncbi:MAG: hypothetical protein U1F66_09685 [bacterium]
MTSRTSPSLGPILIFLISLGWTACSGVVGSPPTELPQAGSSVAGNRVLPVSGNAMAGGGTGILSAPADDDDIQTDGVERRVHFEAFFAPDFKQSLQKEGNNGLTLQQNRFLVGVARERERDCYAKGGAECWEWLDPNLLQGLTLRVWVRREPSDMLRLAGSTPSEEEDCKVFYQDFLLSEKKPEGYNLSLEEMKLRPGDQVELVLFRKSPKIPPFSSSFTCHEGTSEQKSWGIHHLGVFELIKFQLAPLQLR